MLRGAGQRGIDRGQVRRQERAQDGARLSRVLVVARKHHQRGAVVAAMQQPLAHLQRLADIVAAGGMAADRMTTATPSGGRPGRSAFFAHADRARADRFGAHGHVRGAPGAPAGRQVVARN